MEALGPYHFLSAAGVTPSAGDRRKIAILQSVIEILATRGVDDLTFESVGKKAGMARSHVVYYFKNRDALLLGAIQLSAVTANAVIQSHLEKVPHWKEKILCYVEGNFDWIRKYPEHVAVYMLLYYRATYSEEYRLLHDEIRKKGRERIGAILELGPLQRSSATEKLHTIQAIQGLVTGNIIDWMTTSRKKGFQTTLMGTLQAVQAILREATDE